MTDCKMNAGTLEAALQKAFELGGLEDGSYHLEAEEIEQVIRAAAPAVQGEPVVWLRFRSHRVAADDVIEGLEICEPGEIGDDGGPAFPAYAAPQPTEQPAPISRNLRSVLSMILNALDRDAAEGRPARGEMASELRSAIADEQSTRRKPPMTHPNGLDVESMPAMVEPVDEQNQGCDSQTDNFDTQPSLTAESERQAPDVAGLVEALELIEKGEDTGPDGWGAFRWADCRNIARAALAAHRKQGGEV